jgi:predicted Zn finger-like uncharacterized protein
MSLVTRCPSCSTMFRVVPDQLRVSEGWVRCGRCMQTFNATHSLFDENGAPAPAPGQALTGAPVASSPSTRRVLDDLSQVGGTATSSPDDDIATEFAPPPDSFADDEPAPFPEGGYRTTARNSTSAAFADSGALPAQGALEPDSLPGDLRRATAVPEHADTVLSATFPLDPVVPLSQPALPGFVRRADRDAFWRRTGVRVVLSLVVLALAGLLALQVAVDRRDTIAAHLPEYRAVMTRLCAELGCRIEALRRIDRLSVDSSGLSRVEGAALYRLAMTLHNRADTELLTPAIDLVLTDAAGATIARRVVLASEFGFAEPVVAAGQELPLQAVLSVVDRRISGYTVELFYP